MKLHDALGLGTSQPLPISDPTGCMATLELLLKRDRLGRGRHHLVTHGHERRLGVLWDRRAEALHRDPQVPAGLPEVVNDPQGLVEELGKELLGGRARQVDLLHELIKGVEGVEAANAVVAGLGLRVLQHDVSRGQGKLLGQDEGDPAGLEPAGREARADRLEVEAECKVAVLRVECVVEQRCVRELKLLLVDGEGDLPVVSSGVDNSVKVMVVSVGKLNTILCVALDGSTHGDVSKLHALRECAGVRADGRGRLLAVNRPVKLAQAELLEIAVHAVVHNVEQSHVNLVDKFEHPRHVEPPGTTSKPVPPVDSQKIPGKKGLTAPDTDGDVFGCKRDFLRDVSTCRCPEADNKDILPREFAGAAEPGSVHNLSLEDVAPRVLRDERLGRLTRAGDNSVNLDIVALEVTVNTFICHRPSTGGVLRSVDDTGPRSEVAVEVKLVGICIEVLDDTGVPGVVRLVLRERMVRELHRLLVGVDAARLIHVTHIRVRVEVPHTTQLWVHVEDNRFDTHGNQVTCTADTGKTSAAHSNALPPIRDFAKWFAYASRNHRSRR
mmetsp:Transcript_33008/g.78318  ORF Transcript_33008/g.78318 Transcript_33008/m.78318 type:complete len:554 (+) Transcript_33008:22-1683(+)